MDVRENFFAHSEHEAEQAPESPKFQKFVPLNDLVLVKRYQEDNSKAGSFIVPEKFRQQSNQGIVVAISDRVNNGYLTVDDRITFGIGNAETLVVDGEEHLLIRYNDIRGVEYAI